VIQHAYGIFNVEQMSPLEVELAAFLKDTPASVGGLGRAEHFWNICAMLWGPKSTKPFVRHPWAERMAMESSRRDYLALNGAGSCVAGDTPIPNPITGQEPAIGELYEHQVQTTVMTLGGPMKASVPFIKGRSELYEVTLANGRRFRATAGHLVRTSDAYVSVESLQCGQRLLGYVAARRKTSYTVEEVAVQAITRTKEELFYDLTVPIEHHYFAAGAIHHNSGKTDFSAVWAIVNWLAAPKDTLIFCTSTSLKESGKRIWGSVKAYYQAAGLEGVGKLVDSLHAIRTNDGSGVFNDKEGIFCIAGEKKDEKDAIGKIIGAKNKRVLLIADELPELTEAILTAALSNLALNPFFQLIALGNFKSMYDAFGVFCRPKDGYGSITVEDDEWETETGLCLHFDGMKSPNIVEGRDRWPIYDSKNLATHRKNYGPDSAEFWRMCRSFPTPIGLDNALFSRADLNAGQVELTVPSPGLAWLGPRVRLSSLDPSYTNGGDRTVQWFGWWGLLTNGIWCLCFDGFKLLRDEAGVKRPRDYQIVRQFKENCVAAGVTPENAAFDGTAASSFGAIISEEWSPQVLKVEFGGAPSDRVVLANDARTARDLYDRRVSELWGVGREFVRAGQIKGVPHDLSRELEARRYETAKRGGSVITVVETKVDMKKRLGFSPDLADAAFVMLELARRRHGALAGGVNTGRRSVASSFLKVAKEKDKVYADLYVEADT